VAEELGDGAGQQEMRNRLVRPGRQIMLRQNLLKKRKQGSINPCFFFLYCGCILLKKKMHAFDFAFL
jgi:hypothetical protein